MKHKVYTYTIILIVSAILLGSITVWALNELTNYNLSTFGVIGCYLVSLSLFSWVWLYIINKL